jgi:predicted nucleic acid-binding protein
MELELGLLREIRRDAAQWSMLRTWMDNRVLPEFTDRILPIDEVIALRCAQLHIPNSRPVRDTYIAATALVHGLTVVTRNVVDFKSTRVPIINPWESQQKQQPTAFVGLPCKRFIQATYKPTD